MYSPYLTHVIVGLHLGYPLKTLSWFTIYREVIALKQVMRGEVAWVNELKAVFNLPTYNYEIS